MKNFKRIIAVLLAVAALFSVFAFSASAESGSDEIVARMYIGHKPRPAQLPFLEGIDNQLSGHTWVYIENLTNHEITVGAYTVAKGKGVSIGTYGYLVKGGKGLYYNVECYRYKKSDPSSYVYLSKEITQKQLDRVSDTVLYSNHWSYFLNCAYSATSIWNAAGGTPVLYMFFPTLHEMQIRSNPSHGEGFQMIKAKKDDCYKQIGSGESATIIPADPAVPDGKIA